MVLSEHQIQVVRNLIRSARKIHRGRGADTESSIHGEQQFVVSGRIIVDSYGFRTRKSGGRPSPVVETIGAQPKGVDHVTGEGVGISEDFVQGGKVVQ